MRARLTNRAWIPGSGRQTYSWQRNSPTRGLSQSGSPGTDLCVPVGGEEARRGDTGIRGGLAVRWGLQLQELHLWNPAAHESRATAPAPAARAAEGRRRAVGSGRAGGSELPRSAVVPDELAVPGPGRRTGLGPAQWGSQSDGAARRRDV